MTLSRPPALRTAVALLGGVLAATLFAGGLAPHPAAAADGFDVTIRRTTAGIPHITAADYASLGFGYGHALAEDNICTIADSYVTVNAQRSRHFGPDGTWVFSGNGTVNNNLDSDFFFARIIDSGVVEELIAQAPPHGPRPEAKEIVRGYVAGYNHYLRTTGVANLPDPDCRGAEWVREIAEIDAYRRFYQLALLASGGVAINEIGSAQPPHPSAPLPSSAPDVSSAELTQLEQRLAETLGGVGSNAYGFGGEVTSNGRGMVLGNPHFPWKGAERLYQAHLQIPGTLDVAGSSLYGVPLVLIGHTRGLAWSHTVSTAFRFTPFQLTLVPGSPTTYVVDGQPQQMTAQELTVEAKLEDGSIEQRTRTLWSTHLGPMMNGVLGLPIFPWTPTTAFAMGDVNAANFRYLNHFFEKNHAQSVDELFALQKRNLGIPWVNTIAADREGRAYYADISVVPHVTDSKAQECNTAVGQATFAALGLPVLDAARSACEWGEDPDSPQPGTFGPGNLPHLFRDDYVHNGNDSYWLTNPHAPLTGFARIIGNENAARTIRTRLGLWMAEEAKAASATGGRLDVAGLRALMFNNRQGAAELVRDDLAAMCASFPGGMAPRSSGPPIDVSAACPVLAAWDLREELDSRGALLFRRFWTRANGASPSPFATPFSASDPVHTPRDLNTAHPQVRAALGEAVADLQGAGIPLDAPLGQFQYTDRGVRVPIHGGPGTLGTFNALNAAWDPAQGYSRIPHGSSFVMAVQFTDGDCPDAWALTTYSQSDNAESPFYNDQTQRYSSKDWVRMVTCEADILADPNLSTVRLSVGPADAPPASSPEAVPVVAPAPAASLPATGGAAGAAGLLLLGLGTLTGVGVQRRRRR